MAILQILFPSFPQDMSVCVCVTVWHAVVMTSWRKSAISPINPDQLWFPYVQGFWDLQCIIDNLIAVLNAEADALIIPDFSWKAPASHTNRSWEIKWKKPISSQGYILRITSISVCMLRKKLSFFFFKLVFFSNLQLWLSCTPDRVRVSSMSALESHLCLKSTLLL